MRINSISSKKFYETRTIHSVSNNIEIFIGEETDNIIDDFLNLFYKDIKKQKKNRMKKEVSLFLKVLIYCIIIFIK